MKKIWLLGLLFSVSMAGFAYGKNASDQAVSRDIHQLRKDYQAKVDKDLRDIGRRIKHLEHQATKAEAKAKTGIDSQIKKLKLQKKEADRKLKELKASSDEAWKNLRQGVDGAVSDLKRAVDELADRFKN